MWWRIKWALSGMLLALAAWLGFGRWSSNRKNKRAQLSLVKSAADKAKADSAKKTDEKIDDVLEDIHAGGDDGADAIMQRARARAASRSPGRAGPK